MKTYSKYLDNKEHVWYDSSNIVYSVVFDNQTDSNKSIKIVFKAGRTYLYKDVDPMDYVAFRDAESQGKIFNTLMKKYDYSKLDDTDLSQLEIMKNNFISNDKPIDLNIKLEINKTGEFSLYKDNEKVFESIEGNVSIINLLRALNIIYTVEETEKHNQTVEEFENKNIINN